MKRNRVRLLLQYFNFNFKAAFEYRSAFFIQVFGMVLNNASFIIFWSVIYGRTSSISGYTFENIMFLWALIATGFGLTEVFLGNWLNVSRIIHSGELDVYLLQPRNIPLNILTSKMKISGWGDIVFGIVLFLFTQELSFVTISIFIVTAILASISVAAVNLIYQSLTFILGKAEEIARIGLEGILIFSTYPGSLFEGAIKIALMTVVPVYWISYLPAEIIQQPSIKGLLLLISADILIVLLSLSIFFFGLRRYESGNKMNSRL